MLNQNKKKLLLGFSLIGAAFLCIIATFFFAGQADQTDKEKLAAMDARVAQLQEKAKHSSPVAVGASREPMKLEDLVKKAEKVYSAGEKTRQEGFLWLDRRTNNFIVTLGALQGLAPGSPLSIYESGKKIDTAQVDIPFDVVSYVKPVKNSPDSFSRNYYRVVIEDRPAK